jgi:hypothetical protein
MKTNDRIGFLEETHRVLDQQITDNFSKLTDQELTDLKKKKLMLKEQIEHLKKTVDC